MPRYFFDIDDGRRRVHDATGMDLRDEDGAMREAGYLLQTLADIRQMERRPGTTTVRVRDGDDEEIYEGTARLEY